MRKLKLKNPTILDVGACIGMYSICYSKIYKNSTIYSYEPVKKNYKELKKNILLNNLKNIYINNIGLSDKKKNIKIGIPDKKIHLRYSKNINDGLFSIFSNKKKYLVKLITLDSFIKEKNIKKIDFIKIDVEGAEYQVLKGAKKTIKKFKPIIQLEYNDLTKKLGKKNISFFINFAKKNKYRIFYLTKNYKIKRNIDLGKDFFSDLIFIKNNQ